MSCHSAATGNAGTTRLAKCDDIGNAKRLLTALPGHAPLVISNGLSSQLYLQVEGKTPGLSPMPADGVALEQLKMIAEWINAGAPIPAAKVAGGGKAVAKIITWLKKRPVDSRSSAMESIVLPERPASKKNVKSKSILR